MNWAAAAYVALGGAIGSVCRWGAQEGLNTVGAAMPWGTLAVNLVGSFAIGLLTPAAGAALQVEHRALLFTGLLGGFTTFSALSIEAVSLYQTRGLATAAAYVGGSMTFGVGLAALGYWLASNGKAIGPGG